MEWSELAVSIRRIFYLRTWLKKVNKLKIKTQLRTSFDLFLPCKYVPPHLDESNLKGCQGIRKKDAGKKKISLFSLCYGITPTRPYCKTSGIPSDLPVCIVYYLVSMSSHLHPFITHLQGYV